MTSRTLLTASLSVLFWSALSAIAVANSDPDTEARIQYAFYTVDVRALTQLATGLEQSAAKDLGAATYLLALTHYYLARLAAAAPAKGTAPTAASRDDVTAADASVAAAHARLCLGALEQSTRSGVPAAEALGLQAACSALLGRVAPITSVLSNARSASQLRSAALADPRNPRVRLIAATINFGRDVADPAARERLLDDLSQVIPLFEVERRGTSEVPSWGEAEAYWYASRAFLAQGDALRAREAIEQALLLAPDFVAARELTAQIVGSTAAPASQPEAAAP
ncbi:MAG: hypothetical protein R3E72_07200 [Steroidobacteraceae bacterium]